ncbi:hypothetical protein BGZ97_003332 [Linnemannia gamsii]|uniref:BRCT domain-containing protein n=1 Tax=Linnemannia gamsii TaxID=64522 RepID=A0A9P6QXA6_9FUNG|nr:hypothetical protein BGZ97_003332 [Linnemannia gamsii]
MPSSGSTQSSSPGAGRSRPGGHDNYYHIDHPTQDTGELIIPGTQSPSLGPHGLQVLPEDVTEEQAGYTSFTPASNRDASYSDHNNSGSSANKSSDDSFNKPDQSIDSQQSNTSSRGHASDHALSPRGGHASGSGSQNSGSQNSGNSSLDSQMSQASQHSIMSFAGVKTSTPRKDEPSQHSTPSDPSPAVSQQSPLGTYSANPDSQQSPTQESQPHGGSPTVKVQMSRQAQRSSQERRPLQQLAVEHDQRDIAGQKKVVDQDDQATLPFDDFGPDLRPDDVEAGFQEAEASFTQASSSQAHRRIYKDDDDYVGEITSQDIHSPMGPSPPAKSKKRIQRNEDDEDVGTQSNEPVTHVEYLSSEEEGGKSVEDRSSIAVSALILHLSPSPNASASLTPLPVLRSRPSTRAGADETSPPPTRYPESPTSASHPQDEPIFTKKPSNPERSRTPPLPDSPPPITKASAATLKSKGHSTWSPRRPASQPDELPSSQNSGGSQSGSSSYSRKMGPFMAEQRRIQEIEKSKRRRLSPETQQVEVQSSVGSEEQIFWVGNETGASAKVTTAQEKAIPRSRSRSISQEIASYPNDQPSEVEIEEHLGLRDKGKGKTVDRDNGGVSSSVTGPSSRTRSATSPSKSPPRPRINSPSQLRRKGSRGGSASTPSTRTNPPRRTHSKVEILRSYKVNDPVWAPWNKDYYAGTVESEEANKYNIHFLDGDSSTYVRFEDDNKALNVALLRVCLTQDMMDKMDRDINWDMVESGTAASDQLSQPEPSSAEASTPPSTPRRGKGLTRVTSTGVSTPGRRGRSEALPSSAPTTPSRRAKDSGIFKDLKFVLSLGGVLSDEETKEIRKTIKAANGEVLEDFTKVIGTHRSDPQTNVVLVAHTHLRTPKYMDALAMNIPRLSLRWLDACIDAGQLQPYQHYRLPTGFSRGLGTIVSNEPINDRGIFDGLRIGLCGGALQRNWSDKLKAAGATVVKLTAQSGLMSCNYIVFVGAEHHKEYCAKNGPLPSLAEEWLIQCMINQRVVAIMEHPSYTDFTKYPDA